MTTDRQAAFIKTLMEERIETPIKWPETAREASEVIGMLLKLPKRPEAISRVLTEDGMYRDPESGDIFKVQYNKTSGDGQRLYAKLLVVDEDATFDEAGAMLTAAHISFVYVSGAVRHIKPEWKMTLAQAEEFGALYGTCVRCGRTLTREESIERSLGPVCVKYFA